MTLTHNIKTQGDLMAKPLVHVNFAQFEYLGLNSKSFKACRVVVEDLPRYSHQSSKIKTKTERPFVMQSHFKFPSGLAI